MKKGNKGGRPRREPIHPELGKLMRQLRHSRGVSLKKLGIKLPISIPAFSAWESGYRIPKYDNANRFLMALDANVNERVGILRALWGIDPYGANQNLSDLI